MERAAEAVRPLLQALHDLLAAYRACVAHTEELIRALAAADAPAVHVASSAATATLVTIDCAELRRRMATHGLVNTLQGATYPASAARSVVTITALLRCVPAAEAAQLVQVRHELLETLLHLQTLQRRAAQLARNGQTVVQRTLRAVSATGSASGYGAQGERSQPWHTGQLRLSGRSA